MCVDIIFFLGTQLNQNEYMRIPLALFTEHVIEKYDLHNKVLDYLCPKESGFTCNSCTRENGNQIITYSSSDRKPIDCLLVYWHP